MKCSAARTSSSSRSGPLFDGVPGIAGATVTGDGRLALVMDLAGLGDDAGQPSTSLQSTG